MHNKDMISSIKQLNAQQRHDIKYVNITMHNKDMATSMKHHNVQQRHDIRYETTQCTTKT